MTKREIVACFKGLERRVDGLYSNQISIRENISRLEKVAGCGHPIEDRGFETKYDHPHMTWIEKCRYCGATIRQLNSPRELFQAQKDWYLEMANRTYPEGAEE